MKRVLFLFWFGLCICNNSNAQSYRSFTNPVPPASFDAFISQPSMNLGMVFDTLKSYILLNDTAEGGALAQFGVFRNFWQDRAGQNDSSGISMFDKYYLALRAQLLAGRGACDTTIYQGNWEVAGPDSLSEQQIGYVRCVWADTGTDSGYVLAGSEHGGLFKTTDCGKHWENITDNAPLVGGVMGITHITVNPLNKNTIYLATSGAGILESFDGGATWQQEFIPVSYPYNDSIENIQYIYITPDSLRLYAFKDDSVYTRLNVGIGNLWQNITPAGISSGCSWNKLQFLPGNRSTIFIANFGGADKHYQGIYETTDSVASSGWTKISTGFVDTLNSTILHDTDWAFMNISVPDNNSVYFSAYYSYFDGSNWVGRTSIFKYDISSHSIVRLHHDMPGGGSVQARGKGEFIVSDAATDSNGNRRNIYFGWDIPYHSYDEGRTFFPISVGHVDTRGMYLQQASNTLHGRGDRLYVGNDGGVSLKPTGVDDSILTYSPTLNINGTGLACGEFNSFATSEAGGLGIGCKMHDGIDTYEPMQSTPWFHLLDADTWICTFDKLNPTRAYASIDMWWPFPFINTTPAYGRTLGSYNYLSSQPTDYPYPVGPPMETDNNGNIFSVEQQFWEQTPTVSFIPKPALGFPSSPNLYGAVLAFDPNASNSNGYTGYVLYNGAGGNDSQQIYYRNVAISGYDVARRINRIPGDIPWTFPISCITTDIRNVERIWASQGGINWGNYASTQFRAWFSPDHGTNWVDISNGLPQRIPATRIVYDETTNMLYCATDAGIYRCDFNTYADSLSTLISPGIYLNTSVQWTCFSKGKFSGHDFPNASVNRLLINHCQGKLYASTYGRSIWSTDINPPGTTPNATDIITASTVWTGYNQYRTGSISIQPGATLTIKNSTIHMPKNGVITIEKGAQLIVDSSVLTNDCPECFWQGIVVKGSLLLPQTAINQGRVIVKRHSTVEHAQTAITNVFQMASGSYSHSGAIIQATNSYFLNNHNTLDYEAYHNWNTAHTVLNPNLSYFMSCTFLLDNNYKGDKISYPMNNHVYLRENEGISFVGCNFLNRDNALLDSLNGEGIHALNAGFNVVPLCTSYTSFCTSYMPSVFHGFTNGIDIQHLGATGPTVTIDRANFDSVSVGVYVNVCNNVSTTRCNFIVGHGKGIMDVHAKNFMGCYQNLGILSQNTPQFRIEGNSFEGKNSPMPNFYNFGAVIANAGSNTNTLYRNAFDSLTFGTCAIGNNTDGTWSTNGLEILCNTFSNNSTDILIANDGSGYSPQGIARIQGATMFIPSANTFSGSVKNIVDNCMSINYVYNSLGIGENPTLNSGSYYVFKSTRTNANPCTPTISDGTTSLATGIGAIDLPVLNGLKQTFLDSRDSLGKVLTNYKSLIDYGNPDSLSNIIATDTVPGDLYQILTLASPYLSKNALMQTADLLLFDSTKIANLLIQNPDNLSDMDFLTYIQNDYGFSSDDMDSIQNYATIITPRTLLEYTMQYLQLTMANNGNLIMMALKSPIDPQVSIYDTTGAGICMDENSIYYLLDPNKYYFGINEVDMWLKNIDGLWTWYERVAYYNWLQQYPQANAIFQTIPNILTNYTIKPNQDEYPAYSRFWNTILQVENSGRDIFQLTPGEAGMIDTSSIPMFTSNSGYQEIYNLSVSLGIFPPMPPDPCLIAMQATKLKHSNTHKSKWHLKGGNNGITDVSQNSDNSLIVYPNPTSGMVTFEYEIQGGLHLLVTNVLGEKVFERQINVDTGNIIWDAKTLPAGVYLYSANNGQGFIERGKVVVVR